MQRTIGLVHATFLRQLRGIFEFPQGVFRIFVQTLRDSRIDDKKKQ